MTIQRIDDLKEPPIVGRYYLVPCVRVSKGRLPGWWPVTGPRHDDAEIIGFKPEHRHYDLRFITPAQLDLLCVRGRYDRPSIWDLLAGVATGQPDGEAHARVCTKLGPVVYRKRLCRREQPIYQVDGALRPRWILPLEKKLEASTVKCGKCPHRGLPLESLPREPGTDIVTCPGHGLRWDLKTGKMVI